jgi:predicted nucleic acid-binding protein
MPARQFFDTNILLYAYDLDAGKKQVWASTLVLPTLEKPTYTSISIQVLQEFCVNFSKKGASHEEATGLCKDFGVWQIVDNTHDLFLQGLETKARWQLSLWDAMIVTAAQRSQSTILYSEDLNHGQFYGSVQVINPFLLPSG